MWEPNKPLQTDIFGSQRLCTSTAPAAEGKERKKERCLPQVNLYNVFFNALYMSMYRQCII